MPVGADASLCEACPAQPNPVLLHVRTPNQSVSFTCACKMTLTKPVLDYSQDLIQDGILSPRVSVSYVQAQCHPNEHHRKMHARTHVATGQSQHCSLLQSCTCQSFVHYNCCVSCSPCIATCRSGLLSKAEFSQAHASSIACRAGSVLKDRGWLVSARLQPGTAQR